LVEFRGITLAAKAGGDFINPVAGSNGYAALAGARLSLPVFKNVSMVTDYTYQDAQVRVNKFSGNNVSVGLRYSF